MIYCTNKTWKYKKAQKEKWHRWFAWHRCVVEEHPDGSVTKVWLQWVWRQGEYYRGWEGYEWRYKYSVNKPRE